jgi:uncharacterized membrane protein HdeD (DUF308 family)
MRALGRGNPIGLLLLVAAGRTWWLCTKYTSSQLDGWALSVTGVVGVIVGVYVIFGLPFDDAESE